MLGGLLDAVGGTFVLLEAGGGAAIVDVTATVDVTALVDVAACERTLVGWGAEDGGTDVGTT